RILPAGSIERGYIRRLSSPQRTEAQWGLGSRYLRPASFPSSAPVIALSSSTQHHNRQHHSPPHQFHHPLPPPTANRQTRQSPPPAPSSLPPSPLATQAHAPSSTTAPC